MANSNLAGLRETFPSGDFTLVAASGGSTTEATSLYYWVNGYSRGGMNLLTSLGQVSLSAGQKLVWTVTNKADGDDVFGWILSANDTNDATGAKILCVARARETVNQDTTIDPPITVELTRDAHFLLGEAVTNLPTGSDLLDGMIRYQGGNYRQYNAETLEWETVNGWSTYLASTLSVLTPGLFKNGCDLPILSNESIIPLPDYDGGTTPYIRLSLLNGLNEGNGVVLPTGTRLSLFVRLNGSDDLGGQYLSGRIELVPRQKTRRLDGTVTALSNTPTTWAYGTPFYTLTSDLERGYALEFDLRVVGATLPAGVTFTFFVAEYGLLSQPAIANASGDLVYATGGRLRILPALLGAVRLDGSGVVNVDGETTSYPINANATEQYSLGLQSNTANQKAAISGIGNGSIEFKTGTLLPTEAVRAIVSTEAITCAPSAWVSVGAIADNQSINVTVNYPCDANGVGTIRADYPDVIAGLSGGEFNPNQLRVFLRRDGTTITETTAIAVNPSTSQIFTVSAIGTSSTLPTNPGDAYQLWDYETISGVSSISASDLPAGTYEVAIAYQYLGNRICKISHAVSDGCIPELSVSLAESTELASAYSDVYNSSNVLQAKTTGLQFGGGLTTTKNGDRLIVSTTNKIYADKVVAPTANDDASEGYIPGDKWINAVTEKEYTLADNTVGAAVWKLVPQTATDIGLGNVNNTSDVNKPISNATQAALDLKINTSLIGALDGICPLDGGGKVDAVYLPSYVDDVLEYANLAALPVTGETGKIYITLDTSKAYRWTGSVYVEITSDPLPAQTGHNGKFLTTNGTVASWSVVNAANITVDTTNFNVNLSGADTTVQAALETLDELVAGAGTGLNWQGTWNSGTNYVVDDGVEYQGSSYIANAPSLNKIPGTDPEWDLLAQKGNTGSAGVVSSASGIILTHTNTPSDPGAGNTTIYAKTDGKLYFLPTGGSETEVGSGTGGGREVLTADRTYYVRTDGNDSNDGLSDSAGGAFLTIQKAIDVTAGLDLSVFNCNIQLQSSTYVNQSLSLKLPIGAGLVKIKGDITNPSNFVISSPNNAPPFSAYGLKGSCRLRLSGVKIIYNSSELTYLDNSYLEIEKVIFSRVSPANSALYLVNASILKVISGFSVEGSFDYPFILSGNSYIDAYNLGLNAIGILGNPTWGTAFILGRLGGIADFQNTGFTGTANGPRVNLDGYCVVRFGGTGTALPGSSNGIINNSLLTQS